MDLLDIKGVGTKTVEKLNKLDIFNPTDLLMFTPNKYIDMTPIPIKNVRDGFFCVIKAKYVKKIKQFHTTKLNFFSIQAMDSEGNIVEIDWFNQDYVSKILSLETDYIFYGRFTKKKGKLILTNPEFEINNKPTKLIGVRVEYKTKGLLTNNKISKMVSEVKEVVKLDSFIDKNICKKYNIDTLNDAICKLHFPNDISSLEQNLNRIKLEKIINLMFAFNSIKNSSTSTRKFNYTKDLSIIAEKVNALPFKLTRSQQNALKIIVNGLKSAHNVSFMLLGDVGSGKTIVALLVSLYVILCGGKACMLVPSETLLNQHFDTAIKFLPSNIRIQKLSSSTKIHERKRIIDDLNNDRIDLILGTQSLINEEVNLSHFTFAIVDEQQKFGVNEKGKVLKKLNNIDSLIMSATPIPRAINLMFSNTLNVVEIEKTESKKTNIITKLVPDNKLYNMLDYLYNNRENAKTFVVCPNIYGSESRLGVYDVYEYFKSKFDYEPLVINSKLSEEDKAKAINDFVEGKNDILVSTTIIEVGVDIQDAKNMVILNSECFGLSSLHQLRGRVGRDGSLATCYLHYSSFNEKVVDRLSILKETTDGFKISKFDYNIRGGGEFFGTKQSGNSDLIDLNLIDSGLIVLAQQIFENIKDKDISLVDTKMLDNISKIVLA